MSDEMQGVYGSAPDGQTGTSGTVETAKAEAADVKDTTVDAAKDVAHTAKGEADAVLDEARQSVNDLYHQARRELADQAATQQQRLSWGLRSTADDLDNMAQHANPTGIAGDVVQRVAQRLEGASTWLSMRDPDGVVAEVKAYARRRPGAFIFGALVAGVVAGRLTRALASQASSSTSSTSATPTRSTAVPTARPAAAPSYPGAATQDPTGGDPFIDVAPPAEAEAPLYTETASRLRDDRDEGWDERSNTV